MENYLDMIHKRRSTRVFNSNSMTEEQSRAVLDMVSRLRPLFPEIKYQVKLVSRRQTLSKLAPYYLVFYSEEKPFYLQNAGYILEQADLNLQGMGYGAVFYGFGRPDLFNEPQNGMKFVIMLAFGFIDEQVFRASDSEFDRALSSELISGEDYGDYASEVRLAPSSMNSQPWLFIAEKSEVHIYRDKSNPLNKLVLNRFNAIDIGIVTFVLHAALAARGKSFLVCIEDKPPFSEDGEYQYSVKFY